ncbi:MAG: 3-dehydroquinate synthase [Saprospiraceae bacterium]
MDYPTLQYNWDELNSFLTQRNYTQIVVLTDENTQRDCLPIFQQHFAMPFSVIEIAAGEAHKNLATCEYIWQQLLQLRADRNTLFINLGGGVIGDMGGFCAASFKRGIDFIHIPTTLLAQIDAAIGGKLGIDFQYIKNVIGLFRYPVAVLIYPTFLHTLPPKELLSGYAECCKHALIADKNLWQLVSNVHSVNEVINNDFIFRSMMIKDKIIRQDPFEKGVRKALNVGHTLGHAIESFLLPTPFAITHGEAVAVGIFGEAYIANSQFGLSKIEFLEIQHFVKKYYGEAIQNFKKAMTEYAQSNTQLLQYLYQDKKNIEGKIQGAFVAAIGEQVVFEFVAESAWLQAVGFLIAD